MNAFSLRADLASHLTSLLALPTLEGLVVVHATIAVLILLAFVLSGLDDALIDLMAGVLRLKPRLISEPELKQMIAVPQKNIAIIMPAWDEGEIISHMLKGNLRQLQYTAYHFFVGVYPNDPATQLAVESVGCEHSNVHAICNPIPGPTSKGQMLNAVVLAILEKEKDLGVTFDALLMQDAEDVIHPLALVLGNHVLNRADFVQIPVFSLPLPKRALVGGTYQDEFAELHTKDLLVRARLGSGVPSAGVGTFLSRKLVLDHLAERGELFSSSSLTEDYELGLTSTLSRYRGAFECAYTLTPGSKKKQFIATREFFPRSFRRSVRQKTRWTIGIIFQGWRSLGWQGNLRQRYFLYRDRKGIYTHLLTIVGYGVLFSELLLRVAGVRDLSHPSVNPEAYDALLLLSGMLMVNRLAQRVRCTARVYGWWVAALVPLRWPVGVIINSFALVRAAHQVVLSRLGLKKLAWSKTQHEAPQEFVHS